jgi:hypothetical protein
MSKTDTGVKFALWFHTRKPRPDEIGMIEDMGYKLMSPDHCIGLAKDCKREEDFEENAWLYMMNEIIYVSDDNACIAAVFGNFDEKMLTAFNIRCKNHKPKLYQMKTTFEEVTP